LIGAIAAGIRFARSAAVNLPQAAALTVDTSSGSTVRVSGSLVVDTSPKLRALLLQAIERRVGPTIVIDLSLVTYLDTSGIATLLDAARVARAHAVRLRVVGVAGEPKMLAQVTEMDRIFLALGSAVEFVDA
jgi:anti-sigma B factor antagonist